MLRQIPWVVLLVASVIGGAIWQWQSLATQRLDIGSALDDSAVLFAYAAETSSSDPKLTFRWTKPSSELRLASPPPASPAILTIRAFPPPTIAEPNLAIRVGTMPTATLQLARDIRVYQLVVDVPQEREVAIVLHSLRANTPGDPRAIGVGLDWVALKSLASPTALQLWQLLLIMPDMVLSLLALAVVMWLLQTPEWARGLAPLTAVALLILVGIWLPDAKPRLMPYLTLVAMASLIALVLFVLLRRARLLPTTDRNAQIWIVLCYTLIAIITFVPSIKSDGMRYYAYLRSLTLDGDFQFTNEYNALDPRGFQASQVPATATGLVPNNASVGPSIVWAPTYAIAHGLALLGTNLGLPWPADGYSEPYIVLVAFGSVLAGLVTLLGCYWIVRRWVEPPIAVLSSIGLLLGSNLLFYAMREGSFAHAVSAATATLYILAWLRLEERPTPGRWAALGAAGGGVIVTYWIGALTFALPALSFVRLLWLAWRSPTNQRMPQLKQLLIGGMLAAALALLVFLPQMLAWWVIYGSPLVIPHGGDYVRPRESQALRLLFSHLYGLLPWTPAFFIGLVGLPLLWRRSRWLTICLLIAGGMYFFYNASLGRWFAGGSFGLRRLTLLTPWFAIGLALLLDTLRRIRSGLPIVLVALTSGWATMLLVRYDFFLIPHSPEAIDDLPGLAFYFSRETLPFWALRPWLSSGFLYQPWYGFTNTTDAVGFGLLALAMVLALAATCWIARRPDRIPDRGL